MESGGLRVGYLTRLSRLNRGEPKNLPAAGTGAEDITRRLQETAAAL
jgi:hypothetical protein